MHKCQKASMQIESSRTTGNWAYVVRDSHHMRLVATGDRRLAMQVLKDYLHK